MTRTTARRTARAGAATLTMFALMTAPAWGAPGEGASQETDAAGARSGESAGASDGSSPGSAEVDPDQGEDAAASKGQATNAPDTGDTDTDTGDTDTGAPDTGATSGDGTDEADSGATGTEDAPEEDAKETEEAEATEDDAPAASRMLRSLAVPAPEPQGPIGQDPATATTVGTQLKTNQSLDVGDQLESPNGRYRAVAQGDGNIVVYRDGDTPVWASRTYDSAGATLDLQRDGNLVAYTADDDDALWHSSTYRAGHGMRLVMQDDGNLVLYAPGDVALWSSKHGRVSSTLTSGRSLVAGQALVSSNGSYRAVIQKDGNFVVYGPGESVHYSARVLGSGARLSMQSDGNVVVYHGGTARWDTGTFRAGSGMKLVMQNDGNLVLYAPNEVALWSTKFGKISDTLRAGKSLAAGQAVVSSRGAYRAVIQKDGNLVVYGAGQRVHFSSRVVGSGARLALQADGNLVNYHGSTARWASNTAGTANVQRAVMQEDGNFVIYRSDGSAVWSTKHGKVTDSRVDRLVAEAFKHVGTPYGVGPGRLDCSGFTQLVYSKVGVNLPRTTSGQRTAGRVVPASQARAGDLIWSPGHVAIYLGNGQQIAARSYGVPLHASQVWVKNPTYIRVL